MSLHTISKLLCCMIFANLACTDFVSCENFKSEKNNQIVPGSKNKKSNLAYGKGLVAKGLRYASASRSLAQGESFLFISPPDFPNATVLSQNRNVGFKHGALSLTSEGIEILKSGTYLVNYSTNLNNPGLLANPVNPVNPVTTIIFLVRDGYISLNPEKLVGSVAYLAPNETKLIQGSQILKLEKGDKLSLIASAVGSNSPYVLLVPTWNICISEISSE